MRINIETMLAPAVVTVVAAVILLIARTFFLGILRRWAKKTETKIDDIIIESIRVPSLYWCAAVGLYIGVDVSGMPHAYSFYLNRVINVLIILSVTSAAANISGKSLGTYVQRLSVPLPTTGLAQGVLKGLVYATGILIVLNVLGVSIAPLVAALGVGGLAVALALQDTLADLFAGIHILVEKSIHIGDFVKIENGQEGYVSDITWRTTRLRTLPNNIVIIPNRKLAQSVVTNYHLPEPRMSVLLPVSVSYSSRPDTVEKILVEEAKLAAAEVPGLLADPEPFVRFIPGFGESSLDFTLICQVKEFTDQYLAQHMLRKRIFERFSAEGIEIPFPQRTVHVRAEGSARSL